ncbi:MAG TPA: preprotein translocase subunit YajC [Kiloniellales bacterium]|nr:preprotein translocase subunit YajC [Kiloniellales bacterium]
MLISTALAQEGGGGGGAGLGGPDLLTSLLPLVLIFVVFYFLMIRPQQKKMKEHRNLVANLRRGDRVVTGGGLIGVVTRVINEAEVQVEIADGVRVRVLKHTVTTVLGKGEPAKAETAPAPPTKS